MDFSVAVVPSDFLSIGLVGLVPETNNFLVFFVIINAFLVRIPQHPNPFRAKSPWKRNLTLCSEMTT
jgi:hypothetical protein